MQMSRKTQQERLLEEVKRLRLRVTELENLETQNARAIEILENDNRAKQKYFDIAEVILIGIDLNQKVTFINKKGCEILGYSEDEITGKNWFDNFLPDRDRNRTRACFAELMTGNVDLVEHFENPVLTKNGQEKIIEWHNAVLKNERENVLGILSSGKDVTKYRLQENKLYESQELYQKVIQQSIEAVYMFDPETGRILETNNAFLDYLGFTKEESSTLSVHDFVLDKRENINAYINHILMSGATTIGERLWLRKDKTLINVQVTANKIVHQGRDICFVIARDITEQKRAEAALQESEGKLNAILHAISDYISMIDNNFNILWVNEVTKKTFGGDDIVGKKCYEVYHNRNIPCDPHTCPVSKTFNFEDVHEHDTQVIDRDGRTIYFHCTSNVALRDNWGKPVAVLEVSRDITKQKLAENELRAAKEQLQTLSKRLLEILENERRHIARELHDEIGQELSLLRNDLETMCMSSDQISVGNMKGSIIIVDRLIHRINELSFDLRPAILDDIGLLPALRWYANRIVKNARLNVRLVADSLDHAVPAEIETACFRVAQEALINVVRHANARSVTIKLRQKKERLEMNIKDDGIGFDVKSAQKRAATGESFGLLGMQERVILAGGSIEIESVPERGTEVRACFLLR
jgi:PAS domain S-box-containing protein